MIIKPWMMCTSTSLPVMKPYAKPATSSLSNGNVNGKTSRKSANTCEPSSKVYALSFVLNLVMPLSVEEQKPFNCMPIQKKMKKYVTLISRLFTHLSIRTAAILLGTLASSPNLHPPTFPLTLVWWVAPSCKPAELYHPVLPYRTGEKLTFPLCSSCVESQLPKSIHNRTRYCHHTDTDQALKGTWCTPELEEALM